METAVLVGVCMYADDDEYGINHSSLTDYYSTAAKVKV